jgi:hypothetical protein
VGIVTVMCCWRARWRAGSYGVRVCQHCHTIRHHARPRVRSARGWSCPRARAAAYTSCAQGPRGASGGCCQPACRTRPVVACCIPTGSTRFCVCRTRSRPRPGRRRQRARHATGSARRRLPRARQEQFAHRRPQRRARRPPGPGRRIDRLSLREPRARGRLKESAHTATLNALLKRRHRMPGSAGSAESSSRGSAVQAPANSPHRLFRRATSASNVVGADAAA